MLTLTHSKRWVSLGGDGYRPEFIWSQISGFEVLSEPRSVTAKAVLERARAEAGPTGLVSVDGLAREFGVES